MFPFFLHLPLIYVQDYIFIEIPGDSQRFYAILGDFPRRLSKKIVKDISGEDSEQLHCSNHLVIFCASFFIQPNLLRGSQRLLTLAFALKEKLHSILVSLHLLCFGVKHFHFWKPMWTGVFALIWSDRFFFPHPFLPVEGINHDRHHDRKLPGGSYTKTPLTLKRTRRRKWRWR